MKPRTDEEYSIIADSIELPAWFSAELPEPEPTVTITYKNKLFHLSTETTSFTTIIAAYDYARSLDNTGIIFDPSINKHGGKLSGEMFFCAREANTSTSRLLMAQTTQSRLQMLKYEYAVWTKETHPTWLKNQNDWVEAYNWLQHHPAFWYRNTEDKTFNWGMDEGLKSVWQFAYRDKKKNSYVGMEHGTHVEPEYKYHYHDVRLDVTAKTFEKAYILLAKKVNKFFNPDGTERENVSYKKSRKEIHLYKLLQKAEAQK